MSSSPASADRRLVIFALTASTLGLSGCFGLAATGAAVGTMAVLDRRSLGAQTEDQAIELRGLRELNRHINDSSIGSVSITSFNRRVLLSGQADTPQTRQLADDVVRQRVPNIREIFNEVEVVGAADFATRTKDTTLTARVKAGLVRERNLSSNAIKVVTERSTVYLMGLVTQNEGQRAAIISSQVSGVTRVVTLFEYVTEEELSRILTTHKQR
ncbi:MAG TPA: BON domain-containing protein [Lautropia sp.]|nr:BON domain-containing protein [Lautropia sp.]